MDTKNRLSMVSVAFLGVVFTCGINAMDMDMQWIQHETEGRGIVEKRRNEYERKMREISQNVEKEKGKFTSINELLRYKENVKKLDEERQYLKDLSKLTVKKAEEEIEKLEQKRIVGCGSYLKYDKFNDVLYPTRLLFNYAFKYYNETNKDLRDIYLEGIKYAVSKGADLAKEYKDVRPRGSTCAHSFSRPVRAIDLVSKENMGQKYDGAAYEYLKEQMMRRKKLKMKILPIRKVEVNLFSICVD